MNAGAEALKRIQRARSHLIIQQPFLGTLALHLQTEEATNPAEVDTMATDGQKLYFWPPFVLELSEPELIFVCAHEVMHCAYNHHTRRQGREPDLWNEAGDYAINRDLIAAKVGRMPQGGLYHPRFNGMGAEEIYSTLQREGGKPQQPGQQGAGAGNGAPTPGGGQPQPGAGKPGGGDPGRCGKILDAAPAHDSAALAKSEAEWQARTRQAIAVAKAHGAGTVPGGLEELVRALNTPRVDWRAVLRRFVDDSNTRDFSWMRPNRRHVSAGLYLPGYVPDRPSHIVAIVDTSGSMSAEDLAAIVAELQAVLDEGAADRVSIVYADTRVHRVDAFDAGDTIAADVPGRGGTAFRQPLEFVARNMPDASAILYLTDCDSSDWGDEPAAPILWIVTGAPASAKRYAARAPFGEAIILQAA